jgi:hypothetical protein
MRAVRLPQICGVVLLVFGFLPIVNWIPGGHEANWYQQSASEWASGSVLTAGIAAVFILFAKRFNFWPGTSGLVRRAEATDNVVTGIVLLALTFAVYAGIARYVFAGKPLLVDEIAEVFQARIFASGRLSLPVSVAPEFFSTLNVVDTGGRTFAQFPPGGPLMLVPGVLAGAPWLMGPAFGAGAAVLYWALVRQLDARPGVPLGATLLFAFGPFVAFMAGSHMNHVPTLFWLCLALWSLERVVRSNQTDRTDAIVCGLSFGVMASIRPLDAAVFAVPAGIWLVARAIRQPSCWHEVIAAGVGISVPIVALLTFNTLTTGSPLLFGYEVLWGKSHGLGFHRAPWGIAHTPLRGLELVSLYFLRLQRYLFETPFPSMLPATIALLITPRVRGFDRYLLVSSALLVLGYFAYWHDGFFLGPRFFYLLVPVLALWTARLPALCREQLPRLLWADRFVLASYFVAGCIAITVSIPIRGQQYARGLLPMRQDYLGVASRAGIHDALILVRESWGAQLIARLWALGISHGETETLYRDVDACVLETNVARLEQGPLRGEDAANALLPLLKDSTRVVRSSLSPDETERMSPGLRYSALCAARLVEDRAGYTFLAPILASRRGSNVYARDLHDRDTLLLQAYRGRAVYVLRPASSGIGAPLELVPLARDSALADWRRHSLP